ncbi:DsbA family protein [Bacillus sp. FSL K6-6540]|uniref:DsbA family protein n=1 Tax=Bacillus sp. FSL K6-6540 TaxID=2921512 RepID=UPI0030F6E639
MNKKKYIITLAGTVIGLFAIFVFVNYKIQYSELEGIPNYTEIKGNIVIDRFKYEKQPSLGSSEAKVKVVEFADFKCPACKNWTATYFDQFKKDYIDTGKVQLYFMNYAFIDRDSILAASAGEAIYHQSNDKFWDYYKKLYQNQGKESEIWATPKFLLNFVKNEIDGIDYEQFRKDLTEHTYMLDVKEDYKTAGYYGINGTPQFVIDDQVVRISSYEELTRLIDQKITE